MRILIDPGTYNCLNLGDVAMLQAAVDRLRKMMPAATLNVVTDAPHLLAFYCRSVEPVSAAAFRAWFQDNLFFARGQRFLPAMSVSVLSKIKRYIRRRWPRLLRGTLSLTRPGGIGVEELQRFFDAVYSADCIVICGQGFLTDHVGTDVFSKLNLVAAAEIEKIPCVLLGQGLGPLTNTAMSDLGKKLLKGVEFLGLRERLSGVSLCHAMNVPKTKYLVTGDEAIEMARRDLVFMPVEGVGINVRLSPSSGLDETILPTIAAVLEKLERSHDVKYVPVPIARDHDLRDVHAIRRLLALRGINSDGGVQLEFPEELIGEIAKCRIVLTGAYHAAVFALSQGVPTVCIARSSYFWSKFEGLADQFGPGCFVVPLNGPYVEDNLFGALLEAWNRAAEFREPLLRAAALQVMRQYRAYNRVGRILRCRVPGSEIARLMPPARTARVAIPLLAGKHS